MGKRSPGFKRRERDFYHTPARAVDPLLPHIFPGTRYWEPCAGDGALIRALDGRAICVVATDIQPQAEGIYRLDALQAAVEDIECTGADLIITNPPWPMPNQNGEPVLGMIKHFTAMRPTWMLLAHDFSANVYFSQVAAMCVKIVVVGRVSWMENGTSGVDNAAWYLFDRRHVNGPRFCARV